MYKILEGGAAYGSGLKEKDIITKVDGQAVRSMEELQALLSYYEQGEEIELTVQTQVEGQYQEHTVTVPLEACRKADSNGRGGKTFCTG